jgi:hypothetical protein
MQPKATIFRNDIQTLVNTQYRSVFTNRERTLNVFFWRRKLQLMRPGCVTTGLSQKAGLLEREVRRTVARALPDNDVIDQVNLEDFSSLHKAPG